MPGPPSSDENYVICIEVPGPLPDITIEKWRAMVREAARQLGGRLTEVKLERKKASHDRSAR